jgi:hypothetical protein
MPCKGRWWPSGPTHQLAAAVWTSIVEFAFNTISAERALESAYSCLETLIWQIAVAALAVWSQLEHSPSLLHQRFLLDCRAPAKRPGEVWEQPVVRERHNGFSKCLRGTDQQRASTPLTRKSLSAQPKRPRLLPLLLAGSHAPCLRKVVLHAPRFFALSRGGGWCLGGGCNVPAVERLHNHV